MGIVMLLIAGCVFLSIVSIILLLAAAYRLRDTTLVAPVAWAILSLVLWAHAAAMPMRDAQGTALPGDRQTIVAVALLSTVCPFVAVLGARRPQNKIWPLVVASLLLILILPELPNLLGQGDRQLAHGVWRWFFAGLLIVGWLNFLPTRLILAATLWCLPGLWWACSGTVPWLLMLAPELACTIGVLAAKQWRTARSPRGWNRVWRDFRNLYGVVWALRVIERANALANSEAQRSPWIGGAFINCRRRRLAIPAPPQLSSCKGRQRRGNWRSSSPACETCCAGLYRTAGSMRGWLRLRRRRPTNAGRVLKAEVCQPRSHVLQWCGGIVCRPVVHCTRKRSFDE